MPTLARHLRAALLPVLFGGGGFASCAPVIDDGSGEGGAIPPGDPCDVSGGIDLTDYVFAETTPGWPLLLNEIWAVTDDGVGDPDEVPGDDWLELYNRSSDEVSLAGVYLGDTNHDVEAAQDDLSRFGSVAAGGRLLLYATGEATETSVALRLKDNGEFLIVGRWDVDEGWAETDSVRYPEILDACSLSRVPDGAETWAITTPTPGAPNGD